ncbi:hypothetical protein [Flavobacterium sp. XS2P39]|uniref:hypothetical protein n=1 Tax=Flavobacterium sp. XS2P39 TaxID=3401725 RepID=UPI003AAEBC05
MIKKDSQNNAVNDALDFIKRNWLIITGLLVAIPYLNRYMKEQAEKTRLANLQIALDAKKGNAQIIVDNRQIENLNPLTQNQKRLKITASKDLHAASQDLAHHFGVLYSDAGNWYDFLNPKGWSENDTEIRKVLVLYRNYFDKLEKLYYEVDTNSRSLRKDILKLLNKDELVYLKKYLKI